MNINPFNLISEKLDVIETQISKINEHLNSHSSKTPQPETIKDQIFNIEELANYLRCTPQTIHKLKKDGVLPFYRLSRTVYFKKSEIDEVAKVERRIGKIKMLSAFSYN